MTRTKISISFLLAVVLNACAGGQHVPDPGTDEYKLVLAKTTATYEGMQPDRSSVRCDVIPPDGSIEMTIETLRGKTMSDVSNYVCGKTTKEVTAKSITTSITSKARMFRNDFNSYMDRANSPWICARFRSASIRCE